VTLNTTDLAFAWSPDGTQIAFVREEVIGPQQSGRVLYVADVDGGHLRRLGEGDEPSWSPDGRRIAFADHDTIVTAASDGTGPRTVAATEPRSGGALALEWSPDGRSLLYLCQHTSGTAFGVCLADPDGRRPPRTVWQSASARVLGISFSPDGRSIAVMADSGLDVIDSTTGQVRWHIPLSSRFYYTPVWSPDGSQIAFTGYQGGGCCVGRSLVEWIDVYAVNADGSGLRRLTGVRDRPLPSSVLPGGPDQRDLEPPSSSPVWWPDGSRLFFAREQQSTHVRGLFVMNADGTCETRFALRDTPARPPYAFPPFGPAWRPGARPSASQLSCVDLALAPELGEDTPSALQYPHVVLRDVVTYALTVKNDGSQPATGLRLEIRASGAERLLVAPGACTRQPVITCRVHDDLPARGGMPIKLRVEAVNRGGVPGNVNVQVTGKEASSDSDPSNNSVDFTIWVRPKRVAGALPLARIDGTEADDTLFGRPGGDVILGRGGDDLIYAGDGNDLIYGGDGHDVIHCGRGNDTVYADRYDIVARDCEHVHRTG
jgi:Tol biopolymer transport system component